MYEIYLVTNLVNGKKYVGQTRRTVAKRWAQHLAHASQGRGSVFQAAIRKYGAESFVICVVAECETKSWANYLEQMYVLIYRCTDGKCGYNRTAGGDGGLVGESLERMKIALQGHPVSEETREIIRRKLLERCLDPEYRKMLSEASTGKVLSEEHRQAISVVLQGNQYRTGIPHDAESKAKISVGLKLAFTEGRRKKTGGLKKGTILGPMSDENKTKIAEGVRRVRAIKFWSTKSKDGIKAPGHGFRLKPYKRLRNQLEARGVPIEEIERTIRWHQFRDKRDYRAKHFAEAA